MFDLTSSNGSTGLSHGRIPVLMTYTMATQCFILSHLFFMINKKIIKCDKWLKGVKFIFF